MMFGFAVPLPGGWGALSAGHWWNHWSFPGTFVNGRRILGPNMLKPGFRVRLGDTTLRVE